MPKLFVAVDIPQVLSAALIAIQPHTTPGIRLVSADQMHLTLHYIGEVDEALAGRIALALEAVDAAPVLLSVVGVGQFPSKNGATTLWAGVGPSAELIELHTAVAHALACEGFQPEARQYTPHISLARCAPEVPASVVDSFLSCRRVFPVQPMTATRLALYSSAFEGDVPVYHCERVYELGRVANNPSTS
jgi:2'-5' RNA ligase